MALKLTQEILYEKLHNIHGDNYVFSLNEYVNTRTKITVKCHIHGYFYALPKTLLNGNGCKQCGIQKLKKHFSLTKIDFIKKSINKHGDLYNYDELNYINNNTKVKIICKTHGEFSQIPNDHLRGAGCPKCAIIKTQQKNTYTTESFIEKALMVHGNRFTYDTTLYESCYKKVKIICKKHGEFLQKPCEHLSGNSCPKCNLSKGEYIIQNWLSENNISYSYNHTFKDCINPETNRKLKYDFYIPSYNILIEFDGIQHFKPTRFNGIQQTKAEINFIKTKYCDKLKTDYAFKNKIPLLRIKYDDNILEEIYNFIDIYK